MPAFPRRIRIDATTYRVAAPRSNVIARVPENPEEYDRRRAPVTCRVARRRKEDSAPEPQGERLNGRIQRTCPAQALRHPRAGTGPGPARLQERRRIRQR